MWRKLLHNLVLLLFLADGLSTSSIEEKRREGKKISLAEIIFQKINPNKNVFQAGVPVQSEAPVYLPVRPQQGGLDARPTQGGLDLRPTTFEFILSPQQNELNQYSVSDVLPVDNSVLQPYSVFPPTLHDATPIFYDKYKEPSFDYPGRPRGTLDFLAPAARFIPNTIREIFSKKEAYRVPAPDVWDGQLKDAYRVPAPDVWDGQLQDAYRVPAPAVWDGQLKEAYRVPAPAVWDGQLKDAYRVPAPAVWDGQLKDAYRIPAPAVWDGQLKDAYRPPVSAQVDGQLKTEFTDYPAIILSSSYTVDLDTVPSSPPASSNYVKTTSSSDCVKTTSSLDHLKTTASTKYLQTTSSSGPWKTNYVAFVPSAKDQTLMGFAPAQEIQEGRTSTILGKEYHPPKETTPINKAVHSSKLFQPGDYVFKPEGSLYKRPVRGTVHAVATWPARQTGPPTRAVQNNSVHTTRAVQKESETRVFLNEAVPTTWATEKEALPPTRTLEKGALPPTRNSLRSTVKKENSLNFEDVDEMIKTPDNINQIKTDHSSKPQLPGFFETTRIVSKPFQENPVDVHSKHKSKENFGTFWTVMEEISHSKDADTNKPTSTVESTLNNLREKEQVTLVGSSPLQKVSNTEEKETLMDDQETLNYALGERNPDTFDGSHHADNTDGRSEKNNYVDLVMQDEANPVNNKLNSQLKMVHASNTNNKNNIMHKYNKKNYKEDFNPSATFEDIFKTVSSPIEITTEVNDDDEEKAVPFWDAVQHMNNMRKQIDKVSVGFPDSVDNIFPSTILENEDLVPIIAEPVNAENTTNLDLLRYLGNTDAGLAEKVENIDISSFPKSLNLENEPENLRKDEIEFVVESIEKENKLDDISVDRIDIPDMSPTHRIENIDNFDYAENLEDENFYSLPLHYEDENENIDMDRKEAFKTDNLNDPIVTDASSVSIEKADDNLDLLTDNKTFEEYSKDPFTSSPDSPNIKDNFENGGNDITKNDTNETFIVYGTTVEELKEDESKKEELEATDYNNSILPEKHVMPQEMLEDIFETASAENMANLEYDYDNLFGSFKNDLRDKDEDSIETIQSTKTDVAPGVAEEIAVTNSPDGSATTNIENVETIREDGSSQRPEDIFYLPAGHGLLFGFQLDNIFKNEKFNYDLHSSPFDPSL